MRIFGWYSHAIQVVIITFRNVKALGKFPHNFQCYCSIFEKIQFEP